MLTDFHGNDAKKTFFDFFFQNGQLKKTEIYKTTNSQKMFVKMGSFENFSFFESAILKKFFAKK